MIQSHFYYGLLLIIAVLFAACNTEEEDNCPNIWELDTHEIGASARIDSSELVLQSWNSLSPDAIELYQTGLKGAFEVKVSLKTLLWDTLVQPQFRLEVYNAENPESDQSGVAINENAFYCYVGTEPENRDMRLISQLSGVLTIKRVNGIITCSGSFGNVELVYSDTVGDDTMGVRLILGTTESSTGKVEAILDDFIVNGGFDATIGGKAVFEDQFDCRSW